MDCSSNEDEENSQECWCSHSNVSLKASLFVGETSHEESTFLGETDDLPDRLDLHLCCSKDDPSSVDSDGCCMFRSKRHNLWRKLWKLKKHVTSPGTKKELHRPDSKRKDQLIGNTKQTVCGNKLLQYSAETPHEKQQIGYHQTTAHSSHPPFSNLTSSTTSNISATSSHSSLSEQDIKDAANDFQKCLSTAQLDILLRNVESSGQEDSGCVLVDCKSIYIRDVIISPYFLTCKLWRWPELDIAHPLKRLINCSQADSIAEVNLEFVCCSPYHYSRLYTHHNTEVCNPVCLPSLPHHVSPPSNHVSSPSPSPHHHIASDISRESSQETLGTNGLHQASSTWCHLAYWEHVERIGRLFSVCEPSLDVFRSLPHGSGMCLEAIMPRHHHRHRCHQGAPHKAATTTTGKTRKVWTEEVATVLRTREKIGAGLTLSRESGGVWVYNRSEHPLFINSSTLGKAVIKLPPGFSIKAYDPHAQVTLTEPLSINISFGKGWGANYKRQMITSCPCWLQVLLASHS